MAAKKSSKYPYLWADGTYHSIPYEKHVQNRGTPIAPPPGSYDPNLDVQEGQANLGYEQLGENLGITKDRALDAYGFGLAGLNLQGTRNQEDYGTAKNLTERGYARQGADLSTALAQGTEDYGTNIADLQRQFQRLGVAQAEGQRAAGAMAGSGANVQAARKRAENQAIERSPIDTAYNRFKESNALAQGRLGEDKQSDLDALALQLKRGGEDIDIGKGGLTTNLRYANEDYGTQMRQAFDTNTQFAQDIAKLRQAQAGTPVIFRPGSSTPGAGSTQPTGTTAPPTASINQPSTVGNALVAGPNAPRQPGAVRSITTKKKKGRTTRTYGTAVTTA